MAGSPERFILEMVDKVTGPAKVAESATTKLYNMLNRTIKSAQIASTSFAKGKAEAEKASAKDIIAANKKAAESVKMSLKVEESALKVASAKQAGIAALAKEQAKIDKASAAQIKAQRDSAKAMDVASGKADKLKEASRGSKKGIQSMGDAADELRGNLMKALGPLALAAAGIATAKAIFSSAIEGANFKKQTQAQLESMTGSAAKAKETFNHIQRIADELVIGQDRAASLSTDLMKNARLPRVKLEESITALVALERGQGADASAKLESIIKGHALKRTFAITREDAMTMGTNMQEVYAAIAKQTKQGVDVVRMKMMQGRISARDGLDAMNALLIKKNKAGLEAGKLDPAAMMSKVGETFKRIFEDIDLGPFLDSMREFILLFDRSTVSGKAIKLMMNGLFTVLGGITKALFHGLRVGFVLATIAAMKLYISAYPALNSIVKIVKKLGGGGGDGALEMLGKVWDIVAGNIATSLGVMSEGISAVLDIFSSFVDLISGPAIFNAVEKIKSIFADGFSIEAFMKLGEMVVNGIIAGMEAVGGRFGKAAFNIKEKIVGNLKDALGIHSPARALMPIGHYSMEGVRVGAERNAVNLAESVTYKAPGGGLPFAAGAMASAASGAASGASASSAASGASITVTGTNITINAGNGATAQGIADMLPGALTVAFENLALQLGQPVGA